MHPATNADRASAPGIDHHTPSTPMNGGSTMSRGSRKSIFITADVDHRVERLCERMSCSSEEALKMIEKQEASRSSYYNYYTGKQWGHATSYDLCLNSSILGIEGTAQFVRSFVEGRR